MASSAFCARNILSYLPSIVEAVVLYTALWPPPILPCTATRYASSLESALQRIGDWTYHDSAFCAGAEIVDEENIGTRRKRRRVGFDQALAELACQDLD